MSDTTEPNPPKRPTIQRSRKDHWPKGVYAIGMEGLDNLGVKEEENGQDALYWDGALIKTSRITLDTQERWIAWIVTGATVVAALATVAQAWFAAFPVKVPWSRVQRPPAASSQPEPPSSSCPVGCTRPCVGRRDATLNVLPSCPGKGMAMMLRGG